MKHQILTKQLTKEEIDVLFESSPIVHFHTERSEYEKKYGQKLLEVNFSNGIYTLTTTLVPQSEIATLKEENEQLRKELEDLKAHKEGFLSAAEREFFKAR